MRIVSSLLIASLLTATTAFAADVGPLTAGKPAGIKKAQMDYLGSPLVFFGLAAVGIGIAFAVTGGNNGGSSVPATSGGASGGSTSSTGTAA
jgi:hypothetical protein